MSRPRVQVRKQLMIGTLGAVGRVSLNANFRNAAKFEFVALVCIS